MPKISTEPTTRVLTQLFDSDLSYLRGMFKGERRVNFVIRNIVRSYVTHAKAAAAQAIDTADVEDTTPIDQNVWDKLLDDAEHGE